MTESIYNKANRIQWLTTVLVILILLSTFVAYAKFNNMISVTKADNKLAIDKAVVEAENTLTAEKDAEIKILQETINKTLELDEEEKVIAKGYTIDDLILNSIFGDIFSDREISTLFDGKIEFDGEDYDAEEILNLNDLILLANEDDYEGTPYLNVPEESISYKFIFEDGLNTSEISEEETLIFNFLGKEVKISDWNINEITFTQGNEYYLSEGESIEIDGKIINLDMVLYDAIYVTVDGIGSKIEEGKTKTISGIEIKAEEVLYTEKSGRDSKATIIVGSDVELTIDNGEEYEEDSIWEWVIDEHSIGLVLVEEFTELDEDYNALAPRESVCLPNEYVCVLFNGMVEEDSEEYTFELDTKKGLKYVRVDGNFQSGIDDYDRIYINTTGIYDKDLELINNKTIELGDTDLELVLKSSLIEIDGFGVNYNLNVTKTKINGNWTDISSKEDNFLTNYGILVENPEDSVEDQEFKITVPEEQVEATVSVY